MRLSSALVLFALVALALAQNTSYPPGTTPCAGASTECGPQPTTPCQQCSDGRLGGCASDYCLRNENGGCSWYIRPPCDATPAPGTTPAPNCRTTCGDQVCEFGFNRNAEGCTDCTCATEGACNTACPDPACNPATQVYVPPGPGKCCGSCVAKPDVCGTCPTVTCPASTEDLVYNYAVDRCGCRSCISVNCTNAVCPTLACTAPAVPFRPSDGCCRVCRNPPGCGDLQCPARTCPDGFFLAVRDGDCCPSCIPKPPPACNPAACQIPTCPTGQAPTHVDGDCCPVCRNSGDCAAVLCPANTDEQSITAASQPVCNEIFANRRDGSCCDGCSPCRRTEGGLVRCTSDDIPVCAPGVSTGDYPNCASVSNPTLREKCDNFLIPLSDQNLAEYPDLAIFLNVNADNDAARRVAKYAVLRIIASSASAAGQQLVKDHLEYLTVTVLDHSNSELRVRVCWSTASSDTTTDVDTLGSTSTNALLSAGVQNGSLHLVPAAAMFVLASALLVALF